MKGNVSEKGGQSTVGLNAKLVGKYYPLDYFMSPWNTYLEEYKYAYMYIWIV